jgi:hypothetical protein
MHQRRDGKDVMHVTINAASGDLFERKSRHAGVQGQDKVLMNRLNTNVEICSSLTRIVMRRACHPRCGCTPVTKCVVDIK